jgi:DNA-binding CsgD family transcriptional regulator
MREQGSPTWFGLTTHSHARLLRDEGQLAEAEAEAQVAVEAVAGSDGWMNALPTATLTAVLLDRGKLAEAGRAWRRLGLGAEVPDVRPLIELLMVRARLRHLAGDTGGALDDLGEAARRLGAFGPASINDQPARLHRALLEHAEGEQEAAAETAAHAVQVAHGWGTPGAVGEAHRVMGVVTGDAGGASPGRRQPRGVAAATRARDRPRRPRGLLRRNGARRGAREPLDAALELARDCGAEALEARAGEELEITGIRVPARTGSGPDALTPSERRIAGLAADGASNREIAQALFLSIKTIEMHLGHAYRKLGIGSRRELRTALTAEQAGR